MTLKFYLLLVAFAICISLTTKAQCDYITLDSQASVDSFKAEHGCTIISGVLTISGDDITNLDSLENITQLQGLGIRYNANLTNIRGLSHLTKIEEDLSIGNNPKLASLAGLEAIDSIPWGLSIGNNDMLTDLSGLAITYAGTIVINGNANLESLHGLESLATVFDHCSCLNRGLSIENNPKLGNVDALSNLTAIRAMIRIANNPMLSSLEGLSSLTSVGINYERGNQGVDIENNPMLTNLHGFRNVANLDGTLAIANNDALVNLDGLEKLKSIGGWGIRIDSNRSLVNIDALSSVETVMYNLYVRGNDALQNLDGLKSLRGLTNERPYISNGLQIKNNPSLQDIDGLSALVDMASDGKYVDVIDNPDLTNGCGLYPLIHKYTTCTDCGAGGFHATFSGNGFTQEEMLAAGPCNSEPVKICDGIIQLASQAEVDAYPANYGCSIITGSLQVDGRGITNLDSLYQLTKARYLAITSCLELTDISGLSSLQTITDDFYIVNNISLTQVHGLESLTSVGNFGINVQREMDFSGLSGLKTITKDLEFIANGFSSLDGFGNVETINGQLRMYGDSNLVSLAGLSGVKHIGSILIFNTSALETMGLASLESVGEIEMYTNRALLNFDGMPNLKTIGDLNIFENPLLTSIQGFSSVTKIAGGIRFSSHPMLTSLAGLEGVDSLSSVLRIYNNDALADLEGLALTYTKGTVLIGNNANLESLHGLEGLTNVGSHCDCPAGGLLIYDNPKLDDIDELSLVRSVGGMIQIRGNAMLENIEGLSAVTSVGKNTDFGDQSIDIEGNASLKSISGLRNISGVPGGVDVFQNRVLKNLDGLEGVTTAGGLFINANDSLVNINGLRSIRTVVGGVTISDNPSLLNLDGLRSLQSVSSSRSATSTFTLSNNASLTNVDSLSSFTNLAGPPRVLTVTNNPNLIRGCGFYNLLNTSFCEGCQGTVTFSGNGPGVTKDEILAAGPCEGDQPGGPTAPTNLMFADVTDNSMTVSYTSGEGANGYIIIMRAFEAGMSPQDGMTYSVGNVIDCCTIVVGLDSDTTHYVVYLEPDIDYYFDVIPYVLNNGTYDYFPDKALSGYQRTLPKPQPYPNPFVEAITIPFTVSDDANVRISICDQLGRPVSEVVNDRFGSGKHLVTWNRLDASGNRAGDGVYMYSIVIEGNEPVKGLVMAK